MRNRSSVFVAGATTTSTTPATSSSVPLPAHHQRLRRGLLHPRREPLELCRGLPLASSDELGELSVARPLRGLAHERPGHVALAAHQVEIVQVAQRSEPATTNAPKEL